MEVSKGTETGVMSRMQLNDNKAGMQGLDKERINQIIHEASKGSKFYMNQGRKEEQMNKRIKEQQNTLESITEEQLEHGRMQADQMLAELEKTRDLSRTIVHVDMDAFYAAVEMRDNPSLRNKPMAVGGNSMLSTSNYLARRFGVRAAMPGFIAKKLCPELVIVPTNFDKYTAVSKEIREIFSDYDPNFCPMSLDEAYLDLTTHLVDRQVLPEITRRFFIRDDSTCTSGASADVCKCHPNCNRDADTDSIGHSVPLQDVLNQDIHALCQVCGKDKPKYKHMTFGLSTEDAVNEMRCRIEQRTQLTASAGIAPNALLAKVCSDMNKPNGQYILPATVGAVMDFIKQLPIRKVSGIGKVSEKMLGAIGVETCYDLYEKRALMYFLYMATSFNYFMRVSLGLGSTIIERSDGRQSLSTERTFAEMTVAEEQYQLCESLCDTVVEALKSEQLKGKTVTLKWKTVDFEVRSRASSLNEHTWDLDVIAVAARQLLKAEIQNCAPQPLRLRLMGVRMSNLIPQSQCSRQKQSTIVKMLKKAECKTSTSSSNNTTSCIVMKNNDKIQSVASVFSSQTISSVDTQCRADMLATHNVQSMDSVSFTSSDNYHRESYLPTNSNSVYSQKMVGESTKGFFRNKYIQSLKTVDTPDELKRSSGDTHPCKPGLSEETKLCNNQSIDILVDKQSTIVKDRNANYVQSCDAQTFDLQSCNAQTFVKGGYLCPVCKENLYCSMLDMTRHIDNCLAGEEDSPVSTHLSVCDRQLSSGDLTVSTSHSPETLNYPISPDPGISGNCSNTIDDNLSIGTDERSMQRQSSSFNSASDGKGLTMRSKSLPIKSVYQNCSATSSTNLLIDRTEQNTETSVYTCVENMLDNNGYQVTNDMVGDNTSENVLHTAQGHANINSGRGHSTEIVSHICDKDASNNGDISEAVPSLFEHPHTYWCPVCCFEFNKIESLEAFNSHVDSCLNSGVVKELVKAQRASSEGASKRPGISTSKDGPKTKRKKLTSASHTPANKSISSYFKGQ